MSEDSPLIYFTKCNLLEVTEILIRNTVINEEDRQVLEKLFWERALLHGNYEFGEGRRGVSVQPVWEQSWLAIRLLQVLHTRTNGSISPDMDGTLDSSRKEVLFTSLILHLENLTSDICKELKALFSKILLAHLISKTKKLPKLSTVVEQALLKSLITQPGETHFLLDLISCDHEAFSDVSKSVKKLYVSAVMYCLHNLSDNDGKNKKKLMNSLYVLLLLLPRNAASDAEEIGHQLYSLCQAGILEFTEVLMVVASCHSLSLYTYLTGCESRRMLRHVHCTNTSDIDLINNLFSVITPDNQLSLEEFCLRTISSKNHWIEELIGMATQYVVSKEDRKLQMLMKFPALWPALAINVWRLFSSRTDILDMVLPIVNTCQAEYPNLFNHLTHTLNRLKEVCDWLDEEGRNCLPSINVMLSLCHGHSALYLLQATTRFQGLDHSRLRSLLINLEGPNSWNVRIFDGFIILFSMFDILEKAVDIYNESEKKQSKIATELPMSTKYIEEVSKPISKLNKNIDNIEPLDFRIEIMENIFLLLFLRSEDFCEDKGNDSSTDENEEVHIQIDRPVFEEEVLKSLSLPTPLYGKISSSRISSSSYPLTSQRKAISQIRPKTLPIKYSQGFVCYPWLVNDILSCLEKSIEHSENTCDTTGCDRLTRLKKSVEDARWRLEMISGCKWDARFTSVEAFKEVVKSMKYPGNDSSDSEESNPPSPVRKTKRQRRAEGVSRSESGNNTASGCRLSSSTSSVKSKKSPKLFSTSSRLINLMLSSPESLVSYFIGREDLERASKVIKKFSLTGSTIDVELNFLKEFSQLRKSLAGIQMKKSDEKSPLKEPSLQAISQSTSSGVLTVKATTLIETFFAVTKLPEECCDSKGVVVLDLAVTEPDPPYLSACLLNLASNYFSAGPVTSTITALKTFTTSLRSVLQEVEGPTSVSDILLEPSIPLRGVSNIKQMKEFWTSLEECINGLQSALDSGDDDLADAAYLRLTACTITGQGLVQNYQDDTKQHFLNQLRSYLTCLWKVFSHIIPEGTKYHIMNHSLDNLIGELVFSEGKDPMVLEAVLQPLPLNLVYLVVTNCTPLITIRQLKRLPSSIILNSCQNEKPNNGSPGPLELVSSLLSELLEHVECPSSEVLSLPSSPPVQRVLAATCQLRTVDWTQLTHGDLTFTFLINLYNLMWLHALITLEIQDEYGLVSESSCLRELSAVRVGYQVGNCFLSLADLRKTLVPFPATGIVLTHKELPISLTGDPRAIFLLANHYTQSPAVQVLSSQDYDREVDAKVTAFVEATVDTTKDTVTVPAIVVQYVDHVMLTQDTESDFSLDNCSSSSREHITDFLRDTLKLDITGKDIIVNKSIGFTISKNYVDYPLIAKSVKANSDDNWKSKETRPDILKYLAARNPLLGLIVEKIHCIESAEESVKLPTVRTPLERMLLSQETNSIATLYEHNVMLTSLKGVVDSEKLWRWLDTSVQQQDWLACLEMLTLIPEKQYKSDPRLSEFRDWILEQLSTPKDGWRYCQNISDPQKLYKLILANVDKWSLENCMAMLHILLSMDTSVLSPADITQARQLKKNIQTTSKISEALKLTTPSDPWAVVEELLKGDKVSLALQWFQHCDLGHVEHSSHTLLTTGQLVLKLLEQGEDANAQSLLQQFTSEQAIQVCDHIVSRAQSVSCLQYLAHFLNSQPSLSSAQKQRYEYLNIGVSMLNYIPWQEQEWYRSLVSQPELVVEQLLMSTRISTLETILHNLKDRLSNLPLGSPLSSPCMDALLRRYASKAVDVRVRTKLITPRRQLTPEISTKFTPSEVPPTKEEWVGNDEVTECMCCESSVFSMFNRRHHCRRCGRVVCGACSPHRFKVAGYGNVKVRICEDCYDYILPKSIHPDVMSGPRSGRAESKESELGWWLSTDLVYNCTVREEFTYTHAPSVALCLSILKLHSEHSSLHRFLFTTIESMLQLLRPISPGTINPEVDYSLLVNMIKSLVEFATVSCSQHGSSSDWAAVDGLCAEVDLLRMLVVSPLTCALLPVEPLRGHSALASLRENLLRNELWTLALEVSTKAGLDYNSVWVAWGKACLKAGAWTDARDKFAHCSPHKKDSQLLADILQILQDNPQLTDLKSRLSRLKALSSNPETPPSGSSLDPRVYEECIYYLRTYGTYASNLDFYLNQNDVRSAVCMLLESPVDIQTYLNSLFLPALRTARITEMYNSMSQIDTSLTVFKDYLRASCAYCQLHRLYNVLYQAQLWMCDYVRASMTCIHFFRHNTRTYRDLAANREHLETALTHLQTALKQGKEPRSPLVMQMAAEGVAHHMSTIRLQQEVLALLAVDAPNAPAITVYGSEQQQVSLATTILTAGADLMTSFALAGRVAGDWKLGKSAVLCSAAAQLTKADRVDDVLKLVGMVQDDSELSNQVLIAALQERPAQQQADALMALITDIPSKITALIGCGYLKSAYLLAVKNNRDSDVHRILDAAIRLDQPLIKKICLKRLNMTEGS